MVAKFELSAYGVEEMNKQEMIEVDGGNPAAILWKVVEVLAGIATIIGLCLECTSYNGKMYQKGEMIIPEADSIKIHPDGTITIFGTHGETIVPYK